MENKELCELEYDEWSIDSRIKNLSFDDLESAMNDLQLIEQLLQNFPEWENSIIWIQNNVLGVFMGGGEIYYPESVDFNFEKQLEFDIDRGSSNGIPPMIAYHRENEWAEVGFKELRNRWVSEALLKEIDAKNWESDKVKLSKLGLISILFRRLSNKNGWIPLFESGLPHELFSTEPADNIANSVLSDSSVLWSRTYLKFTPKIDVISDMLRKIQEVYGDRRFERIRLGVTSEVNKEIV